MMHIKLFAICQLTRNLSFEASKKALYFITNFILFFFFFPQEYTNMPFQFFNLAP